VPILLSGPGVSYAVRLYLTPGHIQDAYELSHIECPLRCYGGQPPLQCHSGQAGHVLVYASHPLWYLVLNMNSPNGLLMIRVDRDAGIFALEKLQALAASREAATRSGGQDPTPLSSRQCGLTSVPYVQPSDNEGVPVKTVLIEADAAQTTRIMRDLNIK
jgi:hypothetical protein